jgi:hypothetical protein
MNTMNMPGFTAEASVYKTKGRYYTTSISHELLSMSEGVELAGTCTCTAPGCDNPTCSCTCPPPQDPCQIKCGGLKSSCLRRSCFCDCAGGDFVCRDPSTTRCPCAEKVCV